MKKQNAVCIWGLWALTMVVRSVTGAELDSSEFDFQFNGVDIFDGVDFQNDWSVAGDSDVGEPLLDGASVELNENGNVVLRQTPDNRNFWIQQDSDVSGWEDGVDGGFISWTLEVRAHLIGTEPDGDPVNNGYNLWAADGFQRGILTIQEDSVQSFGRPGEIFSDEPNDDGFHTIRMSYDADEDLYFVWRDGELLSEDGFFAQAATTNNRLIIGDCCTAANDINPFLFEELEIEYVRYDLDGSYAPLENPSLLGDFNGNGLLDVTDINQLGQASASGANDGAFDLTDDGLVNVADVTVWAKNLKNTWIGDANLDGEFSSTDFVAVFTSGKFEQAVDAVWSEGDWNGDGRFDTSDFVAAFTDGGFELGPRGAVSSVPEPSSTPLLVLAGMLFVWRQRR
ncbi:MAG: PEP-CTERM sorting domain-containing protein [Planctomycetales bacterium]|nr:PEP-CTERM sorting domain-containing protein [Planctomycetales bacterium]